MAKINAFNGSYPEALTKDYLAAAISDIGSLSVEKSDENGMLLWDSEDAKLLPIHFLERMTPEALANMIHISKDIPEQYQISKNDLAKYLWNVCDKNSFITLEEFVVIWSEPDDPATFEPSGFIDEQAKRLAEEYGDEYAYEIGSGYLGQLWFERNIAVINKGEIVRTSIEIAEENKNLKDPFFLLKNKSRPGSLRLRSMSSATCRWIRTFCFRKIHIRFLSDLRMP